MKKILVAMILGIMLLSCSNTEEEKTITVEKVEIPYSMVVQSVDLDDSMSLDLFLQSGFDPNYRDENGETLLMYIVKSNSLKSLRVILEYNINLDEETLLEESKDVNTKKVIKRAIDFVKSKKALDILIEAGADINYIDNFGDPLIIKFIKEQPDSYTIELIEKGVKLDVGDREEWTPLMWSTSKNKKIIVKKLLESGADINKVDSRGNSAIYYAYYEDIILELLTSKIDMSSKNKNGENIIGEVYLRAVSNSYYTAVKKIVEIGGNKNYSSYGDTPLGIARENRDEKMIELLESLGVEK